MMPPAPESFLPLRPMELLVLTMLAEGELHGYGIRQAIIDHTDGDVEPEAGNLYRHIRRLERESLLAESAHRGSAGQDDERRRYYRLTALGRRVLAAELERLRALIRHAQALRMIP